MTRQRPLWPVSKRREAARRTYEHANRDVVEHPENYTRLRVVRVRAGLTQGQVSESAGLNRASYVAIELGNRQPRNLTATRIARALGVNVPELFGTERDQELYRLAQERRVLPQ